MPSWVSDELRVMVTEESGALFNLNLLETVPPCSEVLEELKGAVISIPAVPRPSRSDSSSLVCWLSQDARKSKSRMMI